MTTSYTRRRTAGQWQTLIEQWQQSGQSVKQFCRKQSLGYASFCRWRQRLTRPDARHTATKQDVPVPAFIDLSSIGPAAPSRWHIVLRLGNGVELALSQG